MSAINLICFICAVINIIIYGTIIFMSRPPSYRDEFNIYNIYGNKITCYENKITCIVLLVHNKWILIQVNHTIPNNITYYTLYFHSQRTFKRYITGEFCTILDLGWNRRKYAIMF